MVALVLSLIWRQVGSVCELVRVVRAEVLLWVPPLKLSQQAFAERLRTLLAELFLRVLVSVCAVAACPLVPASVASGHRLGPSALHATGDLRRVDPGRADAQGGSVA